MTSSDAIDSASQVLLAAARADGELGHYVRDPVTGERGLIIAVRATPSTTC